MNRRELLTGAVAILAADQAQALGIGKLGAGEGHLGALGAPLIPPSGFAGLQTWWDASQSVYKDAGTTLAVDGDTVQQWNDRSGNAYNASQATGASRPTFKTNQVNGKPALLFNGTSSCLSHSFLSEPGTIIAVYYADIVGNNDSWNTILGAPKSSSITGRFPRPS